MTLGAREKGGQGGRKQMKFTIRPAQASDRERWLSMFERHAALGPEPCAPEAPAYVWNCVLDQKEAMQLLIAADETDTAIGFLLYLSHPYSWSRRLITYLFDLYVEPDARGIGVGTSLMERLAEIGREAGWLKIYWMTQVDNDKARALYDKVAERSPLIRYDLYLNSY